MDKLDFKRQNKTWYLPSSKNAGLVTIPRLNFLMIDGTGYPGKSELFQPAIEALYGMAYTLKFLFRDQPKPAGWTDFVVPPLEGLWWMENDTPFDNNRPDDWRWTLMIRVPDFVTEAIVGTAKQKLREKKNLPALSGLRLQGFEEGRAVQILYLGPYDREGPAIVKLQDFAAGNGLKIKGKHHEIYLSDPNRVAAEKIKTVLRQPVQ